MAGRMGRGPTGAYARKHDPAISFTYVSGDAARCADIQPLRDFDPVKGAFEFITPNLINDMHDGSIAQGDAFLRDFVPLITGSPAFGNGVLFITFDEGDTERGLARRRRRPHPDPHRRARPQGRRAHHDSYADHYSLLRTTQALLGLPCLAKSCERLPITY